jgi:hypothetical protein
VQANDSDIGPSRPAVDARALWAGGVAAALVAALVAVLGVTIARGVAKVPVLAPASAGPMGDSSTGNLAIVAACAALLATALAHLLLAFTPRPLVFFGWIVVLVTAFAVLVPLDAPVPFNQQVATATINICLGIAIGSLVGGVAARSVRRGRPGPRSYDEARGYD